MTSTPILDRAIFRGWLEQNRRRIVGYRYDNCHCPLAQFLQQVRGKKAARVGSISYTLRTAEKRLPRWAKQFVYIADNYLGLTHHGAIRGARALAILDAIEEE